MSRISNKHIPYPPKISRGNPQDRDPSGADRRVLQRVAPFGSQEGETMTTTIETMDRVRSAYLLALGADLIEIREPERR